MNPSLVVSLQFVRSIQSRQQLSEAVSGSTWQEAAAPRLYAADNLPSGPINVLAKQKQRDVFLLKDFPFGFMFSLFLCYFL